MRGAKLTGAQVDESALSLAYAAGADLTGVRYD